MSWLVWVLEACIVVMAFAVIRLGRSLNRLTVGYNEIIGELVKLYAEDHPVALAWVASIEETIADAQWRVDHPVSSLFRRAR